MIVHKHATKQETIGILHATKNDEKRIKTAQCRDSAVIVHKYKTTNVTEHILTC